MQAVISGLLMGLIYALIASGLSLIFGLMEIVNFAHGEHLMLAMFHLFGYGHCLVLTPLFLYPLQF
jgi:branched-chain amino acid transport system permease protein